MKFETKNLQDKALDLAVAYTLGRQLDLSDPQDPWLMRDGIADQPLHSYTPSTDWSQGGPIIEREKIEIYYHPALEMWAARHEGNLRYGPTPLSTAMRCFVASKLGDTVDIPAELL